MGQSLQKYFPGGGNELSNINIDKFYGEFKGDNATKAVDGDDATKKAAFRSAVYLILEKINEDLGSTRFRIPDRSVLDKIFQAHCPTGGNVTEEKFVEMLREVIKGSRVTGTGGIDSFLYIFGVPITTWFIKQRLAPNVVSNDIFIPGVTSATICLLALFNKL